jgi:hypothetical protein
MRENMVPPLKFGFYRGVGVAGCAHIGDSRKH